MTVFELLNGVIQRIYILFAPPGSASGEEVGRRL